MVKYNKMSWREKILRIMKMHVNQYQYSHACITAYICGIERGENEAEIWGMITK